MIPAMDRSASTLGTLPAVMVVYAVVVLVGGVIVLVQRARRTGPTTGPTTGLTTGSTSVSPTAGQGERDLTALRDVLLAGAFETSGFFV